MYRQYENPYELERQLSILEAEYAKMEENMFVLHFEIEDLKQRINFAWQDDEY